MSALATLAGVFSIIPSLPRPALAELATMAINRLDEIDGDPDFQDTDGDEMDGSLGEDDFHEQRDWRGYAGCPVSDPGGGDVEDEGEPAEYEDAGGCGDHAEDQREIRWRGGSFRIE